jgi:hypothetical protein
MDYGSFEFDTSPPARIPILPDSYTHTTDSYTEEPEPVMKPEIYTTAMDSTHAHSPSAMSEVTDNHAMDVDPFDLTKTVKKAAGRALGEKSGRGAVKEVWDGFLDDLLGKKGPPV